MRTAQGPFAMQTTCPWQDAPAGGTRMTLRNTGEPTGFGKIAAPMIAPEIRRRDGLDDGDTARLELELSG